jgi:hypothetical protein
MTSDIKAIETRYKGYRFRSRLEARWAVFFDALGVKWTYESQGFELSNGEKYLPDFWLPDVGQGCYVEIKPGRELTYEEELKAEALALDSGQFVMVFAGDPWPGEHFITQFARKRLLEKDYADCVALAIERNNPWLFRSLFFAWQGFMDLHDVLSEAKRRIQGGSLEFLKAQRVHIIYRKCFCWCKEHGLSFGSTDNESPYEWPRCFSPVCECDRLQTTRDSPEIQAAFRGARGARFEHGETPS